MKMLIICASYEYILSRSAYLKDIIELRNNNYDVSKFKKYKNYKVKVEEKNFSFIEDNYGLEDWQKELVKKGKYNPWNFEEEELEDDDYFKDDS